MYLRSGSASESARRRKGWEDISRKQQWLRFRSSKRTASSKKTDFSVVTGFQLISMKDDTENSIPKMQCTVAIICQIALETTNSRTKKI